MKHNFRFFAGMLLLAIPLCDMEFAADADNQTIQEAVLADERSPKYIDGKPIVKVIIVPKRMVNIVLGK